VGLTKTHVEVLRGDATLAAMLTTYRGQPAVFTVDPPPSDATLPYIITAGELVTNPFDTKEQRGEEYYRDIRCYTARTGSAKDVDGIASRVKQLLHRQPIVVDGHFVLISEVTGPRKGPEEDGAYSRIVTHHVKTNPA
jgi:hypothetical protein